MYTMNPQLRRILEPMLLDHEAKRRFPYDDKTGHPPTLPTKGKITIGIGRNLTDKGLSEAEILYLFNNDLREAEEIARSVLGMAEFDKLSVNRQAVLVNMAFNLGRIGLSGFHETLRAIREERYSDAAIRMKASLWAKQVGDRAVALAEMMKNG